MAKGTSKKALNERLRDILADELAQLPETLAGLPPQERIKAIIELLPYAAPKLKPEQAKDTTADGWTFPTF